jgi:hypothetical protein
MAEPEVLAVTEKVMVMGFIVVFTKFVKAGIFPVPLLVNKLEIPGGTVVCHAKLTPVVVEVRIISEVFDPLQIV